MIRPPQSETFSTEMENITYTFKYYSCTSSINWLLRLSEPCSTERILEIETWLFGSIFQIDAIMSLRARYYSLRTERLEVPLKFQPFTAVLFPFSARHFWRFPTPKTCLRRWRRVRSSQFNTHASPRRSIHPQPHVWEKQSWGTGPHPASFRSIFWAWLCFLI